MVATTASSVGVTGNLSGTPLTAVSHSSVAWPAIFAGGVAAATATIVLILLGSGLGLTTVSPWTGEGVTAGTFGVLAMVWLVVVQWLSSGLAGYLAGRLRTRWTTIHSDEVYFRDSAHGFLAWAVGTLILVVVVSAAAVSVVGSAGRAAGTMVSGATQGASMGATQLAGKDSSGSGGLLDYSTDALFRADGSADHQVDASTRTETARILATGLGGNDISTADRTYLAQVIAAKTGVSAQDAQTRIDQTIGQIKAAETKAKQAADQARKATAALSIIMALSLAIGAFIASVSGILGGWLRDTP